MEVNSKDYPEKVIETEYRYFSPENLVEASTRRDMYVLVSNKEILGTGSLKENNMQTLFVNPGFHGRGIGRKLMKHLEKATKTEVSG